MTSLLAIMLVIPLAGCFVGTALLARSVLAQRQARYCARLQAEWQLVLALFENDPYDDEYMRPVDGRIKAEVMKTLLEHLASESFEIDYIKRVRHSIPREVALAPA
jgi:hypothetical protein